MQYKDLIDTLMLLQNHDACTVVNMKDVNETRRFGFPTALIEVTEEQIENLRVQQSDVCFDVEQEIKFWFSGKFEVQLAYIADDDPDADYKETIYGLHVIYKGEDLNEECTSAEFQRMAPAKVVSMTGMRSSKKALGRKDKYNKLGERVRRG